jgi:alpha-ketoglutarate-dependent taurine dioxygenase
MATNPQRTQGFALTARPPELDIQDRIGFLNQQRLPALITAIGNESLTGLFSASTAQLTAALHEYGAILFRGFNLATPEDFQAAAAHCFGCLPRAYIGGLSPRGEVKRGVYESTKFPRRLPIPQHNEMSYLPNPPRSIAFFCQVAPEWGGETPLADARIILSRIPPEIRRKLERHGVRYHRNLSGPRRNVLLSSLNRVLPLRNSWMDAFSTTDPRQVESICAQHDARVRWDSEQSAHITNTLPATQVHPNTFQRVWFNQVSTFLAVPQEIGMLRWLLYRIVYPNPAGRSLHATLGNGEPIKLRHRVAIYKAIESATVAFPWQRGDFLLIDNYLVTHGRRPFRGKRRILVSIQ